jgi:hypothetical protein
MGFFTVPTITFGVIYCFFVISAPATMALSASTTAHSGNDVKHFLSRPDMGHALRPGLHLFWLFKRDKSAH